MKLLIAILLLSTTCFSQTTESEQFILSYENNTLRIENKYACTSEVRINYRKGGIPKDTTVTVGGNSAVSFFITHATEIKIKADGSCGGGGWLYLMVTLNLQERRIVPRQPQTRLFDVHDLNGNYVGRFNVLPKGLWIVNRQKTFVQ
jgi:hypothetical protein